jgi:hypothetical protein
MVGHGRDMTLRAPAGHDHGVGDRALPFKVDAQDILGLVVIEGGKNEPLERLCRQVEPASRIVECGRGVRDVVVGRGGQGVVLSGFASRDANTVVRKAGGC